MPPRRVVRVRPARRNVEPQEQGLPNAPEVQPQGEVTNAEFQEAIRMLSQDVTNQVGQRENRQEVANTSRIREFLRMNHLGFTGSSVTEDPENFVEELQKVFEIMHVVDAESVPSLIIPTEDIGIKDSLSHEEIPVHILDRQVRKLRTKEVTSVKVLWRNQFIGEATWKAEEDMKKRYPHLFEPRKIPDQCTNSLISTL
ncbi:hypothetical protein MTR67_039516 [Solanum verrucosum]|uniref:Gag-pol polyprotein n=1 Tax=Solanum verrucosum TaxID=315347 RepID=A0AAF0UIA0_SOLVR|nr:hypothetical protein MTR67_039516 [Solanum verrucosum]